MNGDGTHITAEFVASHLNSDGQFKGFVSEGESAWNPASTKRAIYGPAMIEYTRFPDGGWHARVTEPLADDEVEVEHELIQPFHGPTQKLAENLDRGDMLATKPRIVVDGDPVIGPIPSFGVAEAVVVPIAVTYVGRRDAVDTVIAFRVGELVTLAD